MGCLRRFPALQQHLSSVYSTVISPINDWVISPMTTIAKAIYHSEPANHLYQGLTFIRHLPEFFDSQHHSENTRQLVRQISITNVIKYLAPVVIYRSAINYLPYQIESLNNATPYLDGLIISTILARLLVRRSIDNTVYSSLLDKTVHKDLSKHLANVLAQEFSPILAKIFLTRSDLRAFYPPLLAKLEPLFAELISKKNISEKHLKTFQDQLTQVFYIIFNEVQISKISYARYSELAQLFAKAITQVLSNIMLNTPLALNKPEFERILSNSLLKSTYLECIEEFFKGLENIYPRIKPHLPTKSSIEDCDCETKKIVHGNLSSPLYFTGNIILTYWPEIAEFFGLRSPIFEPFKMFGYLLRAMFYAQSFMEIRLNGKVLCTSHRYDELAKNKAYLLGIGSSYIALIEAAAFVLKKLTGIDSFLTRDALGNFLIHLFNITTLAYKDPLPGQQKYPWDPFVPFRKITFHTVTGLQSWLIRELNDPAAKKASIDKIKKSLGSYPLYAFVYYLLGDSELSFKELSELKKNAKREKFLLTEIIKQANNSNELKNKIHSQQSWKQTETTILDEIKSIEHNPKNRLLLQEIKNARNEPSVKAPLTPLEQQLEELNTLANLAKQGVTLEEQQDILNVLFSHPTLNLFLKFHADDIRNTLNYVEFARDLWSWLNTPLSILPLQGGFISVGDTLAHIVSGEPTAEIFKRLHQKLNEAHPSPSKATTENKSTTSKILAITLPIASPVIAKTPAVTTWLPAPITQPASAKALPVARPAPLPVALPVRAPAKTSLSNSSSFWNQATTLYNSLTTKSPEKIFELKSY